MVKTFTAQVDVWAKQSTARMEARVKAAIQSTVEDVITNTPVDTGFLRASFTVTTGKSLPIVTDSRPPSDAGKESFAPQPYALTISGIKMGQTVTGAFVAAYAPAVEYGANGRAGVRMVGRAVQKWPAFVKDATRLAKVRVKR